MFLARQMRMFYFRGDEILIIIDIKLHSGRSFQWNEAPLSVGKSFNSPAT